MLAFKLCFSTLALVSLAGPLLTAHASSLHHHHHHNLASRMTRNRRNLCLPRRPSASPEEVVSSAVSTGYSQVEPTPVQPSASSSPHSDSTAAAPSPADQPATTDAASSSSYKTLTPSSSSAYIPNGIKAGVAGGDAYTLLQNHIGWWYDWSASPHKPGRPIAVPMLWGTGKVDSTDAKRFADFERLSSSPQTPRFVLGYEEPDCTSGGGSSGVSVEQGVREWEALMAPLKRKGTKIGSPSMCKQADETWLKEFAKKISTLWDFTAIHVNKNNLDGVKKDIDHYWATYGKPIWVTEFACVNDRNTFQPCTNQQQINTFIQQVVDYFEHDSRVYAYAFSNGEGLGTVWPMMHGGKFSESGKAYLAAISKYH